MLHWRHPHSAVSVRLPANLIPSAELSAWQTLTHCPVIKPSVILRASGELWGTSDLPELTSLAGMGARAIEGEVTQVPRQEPVLRGCSGSLGTPNSSALRMHLSAWVAVPATLTVKAKFPQSHLGNVRSLPRLKQGRGRGSSSQYYWKSGPFY